MWPIADAPDQAVLDRIDVTILDVAAEILIVADQMFPEPTLRLSHRCGATGFRAAQCAALIAPYALRATRLIFKKVWNLCVSDTYFFMMITAPRMRSYFLSISID